MSANSPTGHFTAHDATCGVAEDASKAEDTDTYGAEMSDINRGTYEAYDESSPQSRTWLGTAAYSGQHRFGEIGKLLPVCVVMLIIMMLYVVYVYLHCLRLFQFELPAEYRDGVMTRRGALELICFHFVTGLMLYCLARCILTHPGTVPNNSGWDVEPGDRSSSQSGISRNSSGLSVSNERLKGSDDQSVSLVEKKHTGARRHCKWCFKYKPDRCHHCRICNVCVLRMDHHCPWVYNCIGFRNHKYFFLLIVYASIDLAIIGLGMLDSLWWSFRSDVPTGLMLALVAGECLALLAWVAVTGFLFFHIWLLSKAMTTVEYCEKSLVSASYNSSVYSLGFYRNACAVLGPSPLFWLLPLSFPKGDGLTWKQD